MKTKEVWTITNNVDAVRMRIYDGDLQISEAGQELLRIEKCQHLATSAQLREAQGKVAYLSQRLAGLKDKTP